jgi:hypothetical protein
MIESGNCDIQHGAVIKISFRITEEPPEWP